MNMRVLFFMAAIAVAVTVSAEQGPKVSYSADFSMETADTAMHGKVYSTPDMERRENEQDGNNSIIIVRHDKKVTWMLMPDDSSYMEMKMGTGGQGKQEGGDLSAYDIKTTKVGSETVNGVKTTKSKVIMTGPKGAKLGGFIWTSKDGITVKLDAISVDKGSKERFKTELTNLQIGKQDPALFEIPAGYTKMDFGGMGGMMGGDFHGDKQPKGKPQGEGFGLKDALDMFK